MNTVIDLLCVVEFTTWGIALMIGLPFSSVAITTIRGKKKNKLKFKKQNNNFNKFQKQMIKGEFQTCQITSFSALCLMFK